MNKNGKLLRLLQKCSLESNPATLGWLIRLALCLTLFPNLNMLSFIFLKEKKLQKVDFFMNLCQTNE